MGEGGKATLAGAPDADILQEAIELLRAIIEAGTATFLVKVKAHRGEPANEEADILADKAISDELVPKEWSKLPRGKWSEIDFVKDSVRGRLRGRVMA